jgi:hypothetical protein
MAKPRVLSVKELALEERAPPSEKDVQFIEKWEPEGRVADSRQVSFIDRLKAMIGVK